MPLYTYKCPKCGEKETKLVKISESELEFKCPTCDVTLEKVFDMSGTSFELKGKGWFKTGGQY